jgi:hypothetical protein
MPVGYLFYRMGQEGRRSETTNKNHIIYACLRNMIYHFVIDCFSRARTCGGAAPTLMRGRLLIVCVLVLLFLMFILLLPSMLSLLYR